MTCRFAPHSGCSPSMGLKDCRKVDVPGTLYLDMSSSGLMHACVWCASFPFFAYSNVANGLRLHVDVTSKLFVPFVSTSVTGQPLAGASGFSFSGSFNHSERRLNWLV